MSTANLEPALIINVETKEQIKCLFKPKEYTFQKQNKWEQKAVSGSNVPQLSFGGGQPATLNMELFFDTFAASKGGGEAKDVRKEYTDAIWKLMAVSDRLRDDKTKKGRPPTVRFQWGKAWSFHAVITSLSQKFTLFLPNGTPVRATLTVAFQQVKDEAVLAPQNPTSGGVTGERVWTVGEGDTLGWIAHKEYGDTRRWRHIAEANQLQHVRRLVPGTTLVIPHG